MEHLGYEVGRLIRIAYGPFQLGQLDRGAVEEVRGRVMRDQLGLAKADATGSTTRARPDRKSVVEGKSVSVRVDIGGRRISKKKKRKTTERKDQHRDV